MCRLMVKLDGLRRASNGESSVAFVLGEYDGIGALGKGGVFCDVVVTRMIDGVGGEVVGSAGGDDLGNGGVAIGDE